MPGHLRGTSYSHVAFFCARRRYSGVYRHSVSYPEPPLPPASSSGVARPSLQRIRWPQSYCIMARHRHAWWLYLRYNCSARRTRSFHRSLPASHHYHPYTGRSTRINGPRPQPTKAHKNVRRLRVLDDRGARRKRLAPSTWLRRIPGNCTSMFLVCRRDRLPRRRALNASLPPPSRAPCPGRNVMSMRARRSSLVPSICMSGACIRPVRPNQIVSIAVGSVRRRCRRGFLEFAVSCLLQLGKMINVIKNTLTRTRAAGTPSFGPTTSLRSLARTRTRN